MNIGYLEENGGGLTSTSEGGDEMTALPRPASAGAAAIPTRNAQEETVLYDYPPAAASRQKTPPPGGSRGSRHRGINNLRKQHSVSCANHCCENDNNV